MMLANRFSGQDVAGWWLSVKFEGCRAFWDGFILRTRDSWLPILAPHSLTAGLPEGIALDGEIYAGLGTFQALRVLVQTKQELHPGWAKLDVRYMVFDAPTTLAIPFEQRMVVAKRLAVGPEVSFVEQRRISGGAEATAEMRRVVAGGGEGVVLRRPGHFYEFGRSHSWLKAKPANVD